METRSGRCGKLCSVEFWEGEVTLASVQAELDLGADPLATGDEGATALAYALFFPHSAGPEIVRLLLEAGADPNFRIDDDGMTLLHVAVTVAGYALHPGTGEELSQESGDVSADLVEIIELLLEYGADAAARSDDGHSALFVYLAMSMDSESNDVDPEIVELLLEHGAGLRQEHESDAMVMVFAMQAEANPEVIRLLLEHGIDGGGWGYQDNTPLHLAAHFGADVTAQGIYDRTPLHEAALNGDLDPQVISLLLNSGADVASRAEGGVTPLHLAATCSGPEVVKLLLERGADVTARGYRMSTPLHSAMDDWHLGLDTACSPPNLAVIRILLENGADVNARNDNPAHPVSRPLAVPQHALRSGLNSETG